MTDALPELWDRFRRDRDRWLAGAAGSRMRRMRRHRLPGIASAGHNEAWGTAGNGVAIPHSTIIFLGISSCVTK